MIAGLAVWLSVVLVAFAGSATLTIWLRPILARSGAVTQPGPANIGRAVPRGGGLAIVMATVAAAGATPLIAATGRPSLLGFVAPALAIASVSLWDDFRTVSALLRLAVHIAAAAAVVWALGPIGEVSVGRVGRISLGDAAWPLSILWIVGMTNAFNFMDGIDGIAGLTAVVAGGCLAVAAFAVGCEPAAIIAGSLAAAAAGFLIDNWPPAKIFMGDVGSTFCGFVLAALPLLAPASGRAALVTVVVCVMWPFVFDASTTFLRRIARRENVLTTHHCHIYQRLVMAGWSHRSVATLYGGLAAMTGGFAAASLVWPRAELLCGALVAGMMLTTPAVLVALVHAAERGPLSATS